MAAKGLVRHKAEWIKHESVGQCEVTVGVNCMALGVVVVEAVSVCKYVTVRRRSFGCPEWTAHARENSPDWQG